MLFRIFKTFAAITVCIAAPAAAALKPAEQVMIGTVDAEQARTISMLQRWVEQNSGTMSFAGVRAVADLLRGELQPLGFKVEWIDQSGAKRAGHLVARHKGRGTKMLLIGHLDTVFEPDSGFLSWQREGEVGHGPGAADDKGGVAVIVAALRAMQAAGTLKKADITLFLTGDEEDAGSPLEVSRGDLRREGKRADVALDFEGLVQENGADMGSVSRRSSDEWILRVKARSAHSSGIFSPGVGYGAIYELTRILDAFRTQLPEPNLTFNVGIMVGGATAKLDESLIRGEAAGKGNIIPAVAIARGDLRALSQAQIDRARAKMAAIVAQPLPGAKAELSFDPSGYPPMAPTAGNRAILARLNQVNADLGLPVMGELEPVKRGAGDISFLAAEVDSLAGMGPASSGDHTPAEGVNIPTIFKQAKRAAILMSRLAAERR